MREMNFFSPYIEYRKPLKNNQVLYIGLGFLMIIFCAGLFYSNFMRIGTLNETIKANKAILTKKENMEAALKYNQTAEKLALLIQYYDKAKVAKESIDKRNIITAELITALNDSIPHEIYLNTVELKSDHLKIIGTSTSRRSIAELDHNLKKLEFLRNTFVDVINGGLGTPSFGFTINCSIKDGANNEAK